MPLRRQGAAPADGCNTCGGWPWPVGMGPNLTHRCSGCARFGIVVAAGQGAASLAWWLGVGRAVAVTNQRGPVRTAEQGDDACRQAS